MRWMKILGAAILVLCFDVAVAQNNPCNCKGYAGPGGPCYSGPGGIGNACPSVCR